MGSETAIELDRCPFCGKAGKFAQTRVATEPSGVQIYFQVRCSRCDATVPNAGGYIAMLLSYDGAVRLYHDDREKAAAEWNRRADNGIT